MARTNVSERTEDIVAGILRILEYSSEKGVTSTKLQIGDREMIFPMHIDLQNRGTLAQYSRHIRKESITFDSSDPIPNMIGANRDYIITKTTQSLRIETEPTIFYNHITTYDPRLD